MKSKSHYQGVIQEILLSMGGGEFTIDPRYIEAYMRLYHTTLDNISRKDFEQEVKTCVECVKESTLEHCEELAICMGL